MALKVAQRIGQAAQLFASLDVAAEQNVTRRPRIAEESGFVGAELATGEPVDRGLGHCTTRQLSPAAFNAVQAARVWSAGPTARRR